MSKKKKHGAGAREINGRPPVDNHLTKDTTGISIDRDSRSHIKKDHYDLPRAKRHNLSNSDTYLKQNKIKRKMPSYWFEQIITSQVRTKSALTNMPRRHKILQKNWTRNILGPGRHAQYPTTYTHRRRTRRRSRRQGGIHPAQPARAIIAPSFRHHRCC